MNLHSLRYLLPLLSACIFLAIPIGAGAQTETEEQPALDVGHTEEVQVVMRRIDFLALDKKGNPITDLKAEEIRIWEAEKEQKIIDLLPVHERRETIQLLKDAETRPPETASA